MMNINNMGKTCRGFIYYIDNQIIVKHYSTMKTNVFNYRT